jgi:hypothetical protein
MRHRGGGDRQPDDTDGAVIGRARPVAPATQPSDEELIREARAALYDSANVIVRPGGLTPEWGCSLVSHAVLGYCASCRGITAAAEIGAWRLHAAGHPAPDVRWARAVSAPAA